MDISGKQDARMFWSWHSPPGHISGDRFNITVYTVEPQVQTKSCGIVFSVFSKAESLRIFLNKMQRSFFLWKKNNHLPFPREKVTFFYEKETFCPEASAGSFWDCLTMSLHQTRAGYCASGRNDISSPFRVANSKKYKTAFPVVIPQFSHWCVQWHY